MMQKARGRPASKAYGLPLLVDIRFQVLFHSPCRGAFHLSLTVLVHYRSSACIEPWKMVLPASDRVSRVPSYSGHRHGRTRTFAYGAVTRFGRPFQCRSASVCLDDFRCRLGATHRGAHNPGRARIRVLTLGPFGLFPVRSPLLRESHMISAPGGTEMFQFSRCALHGYVFAMQSPTVKPAGLPHSDIHGSKPVWRLPVAFRSLPRLSSPADAKASTVRPLSLR